MDMWLFYEVTHALHRYMNPVSHEAVLEMEAALALSPGTRVLDIASGHGEMLIGFAERHGCVGVGVDASPYTHARSERRRAARVPDADVTLIHGRGEEYRVQGERFDVAMCVGASWIWSGFEGTLRALTDFVKPGGLIVSGEPYWMVDEPTQEYCEAEELTPGMFHDLAGCFDVARSLDLDLVWHRRSTSEDWDRYEMTWTVAFDRWARENPDHEDLEEIRSKLIAGKEAYLRWGHRELGFAFWVFRTPNG